VEALALGRIQQPLGRRQVRCPNRGLPRAVGSNECRTNGPAQLGNGADTVAVMSIDVSPRRLADTLTKYHFAYLLTVGDNDRAHVVAVRPTLPDDTLLIGDPGIKTSANLGTHPLVTLVWPPTDPGDYSLIVDGVGSMRDGKLAITPTRAVLHRAAPPQVTVTGAGCQSDCIELSLAAETTADLQCR